MIPNYEILFITDNELPSIWTGSWQLNIRSLTVGWTFSKSFDYNQMLFSTIHYILNTSPPSGKTNWSLVSCVTHQETVPHSWWCWTGWPVLFRAMFAMS
jgi:hypothetical protein